jgi:hypothetical protein
MMRIRSLIIKTMITAFRHKSARGARPCAASGAPSVAPPPSSRGARRTRHKSACVLGLEVTETRKIRHWHPNVPTTPGPRRTAAP